MSGACQFYHLIDRRLQNAEVRQSEETFVRTFLADDAERCWQAWLAWRGRLETFMPAETERRTGGVYCAMTQAVHRWLTELLSARTSIHRAAAFACLPSCHRGNCSGAGAFLHSWISVTELDDTARAAFSSARHALHHALFAAPPSELPGCRDCPCRCKLLLFVTPHLRKLSKTIEDTVMSQQPFKMRLATLEQAISPAMRKPSRSEFPSTTATQEVRHWAYCVVTNAPLSNATEDQRLALLTELRE